MLMLEVAVVYNLHSIVVLKERLVDAQSIKTNR